MPTMQTFQVYRIKNGKLQLVCTTFIVCQEWIFLFPPRLQTGQPPSNCLHPKVTAVQVVKETPKGPKGQRARRSNHEVTKPSLTRTLKSTPFLMKPALTASKKCELDINDICESGLQWKSEIRAKSWVALFFKPLLLQTCWKDLSWCRETQS